MAFDKDDVIDVRPAKTPRLEAALRKAAPQKAPDVASKMKTSQPCPAFSERQPASQLPIPGPPPPPLYVGQLVEYIGRAWAWRELAQPGCRVIPGDAGYLGSGHAGVVLAPCAGDPDSRYLVQFAGKVAEVACKRLELQPAGLVTALRLLRASAPTACRPVVPQAPPARLRPMPANLATETVAGAPPLPPPGQASAAPFAGSQPAAAPRAEPLPATAETKVFASARPPLTKAAATLAASLRLTPQAAQATAPTLAPSCAQPPPAKCVLAAEMALSQAPAAAPGLTPVATGAGDSDSDSSSSDSASASDSQDQDQKPRQCQPAPVTTREQAPAGPATGRPLCAPPLLAKVLAATTAGLQPAPATAPAPEPERLRTTAAASAMTSLAKSSAAPTGAMHPPQAVVTAPKPATELASAQLPSTRGSVAKATGLLPAPVATKVVTTQPLTQTPADAPPASATAFTKPADLATPYEHVWAEAVFWGAAGASPDAELRNVRVLFSFCWAM